MLHDVLRDFLQEDAYWICGEPDFNAPLNPRCFVHRLGRGVNIRGVHATLREWPMPAMLWPLP